MRFLLSGGGTAGHAYPALAVAGVLCDAGHDVAVVGTADGIEARLAREAGVAYLALRSAGWDRSRPWTAVTAAFVMLASTMKARALIGRDRPDGVIGFGGYVSVPLALAAVTRRVPLVLHEQNSVPGAANRLLARWARAVAVTYTGSAARLPHPERAVHTGDPVRAQVLSASREAGRTALGVDTGALMLLVFGGSRGARHVNEATVAAHDRLLATAGLVVVHVAGRAECDAVRAAVDSLPSRDPSRYHVMDYIDDMGSAIAAADLVVARAGATSIAEITAVGRASVLVPYPYATDDHQRLNAEAVAEAGGAIVVADAELDAERYPAAIEALLGDASRRQEMAAAAATLGRPDAAAAVADVALGAVTRREDVG